MAEAFKNMMNVSVVDTTGNIIKRNWAAFDLAAFKQVASAGLEELELKERVLKVAAALDEFLPDDFDAATGILCASLHASEDPERDGASFGSEGICGFPVWPLTEWVALRGLKEPERALDTLKEMTKRFSSEFAIRPFIAGRPNETLDTMIAWVGDPNRHVRRLVSEGSRPRLPWGMRLQGFVDDPKPLLPLLEALRDDPEDYVRRSVANNLNDIAKDHPALVAAIASDWLKDAPQERAHLVRHACRTLLKAGDAKTLAAFGYLPQPSAKCGLTIETPVVEFGEQLSFAVQLDALQPEGKLMIDYAIHFVKANGKRAAKVFKWKDVQANASSLKADRAHVIQPITTRKYYPGRHALEIFVNGKSVAVAEFDLQM